MAVSGKAKTAIRKGKTAKRAFDKTVFTLAFFVGWCGVGLLFACCLLWLFPVDWWDGWLGLKGNDMPIYFVICLSFASLVGWRYTVIGQARLQNRLGKLPSQIALVWLPIACLLCGFLRNSTLSGINSTGFWAFVFWYPLSVVLFSLAMFLLWRSKPRRNVYWDRSARYLLLMTPYLALFLVMAVDIGNWWTDHYIKQTLQTWGQSAIIIQLVIAYFVGGD
ncbi:MAG: hypothetical protein ACYTDT_06885 [Planctomycetota bacterium]|jgi:hypothetical protein